MSVWVSYFCSLPNMRHIKIFLHHHWMLLIILCFGAFLGLYQLDNLPAEIWGDAVAHYTLAEGVRHGSFFYNYAYGGDGPIYTYIVVAISYLLGLSFYTLKFTSVIVYLLFLVCMYFLTDALFKRKEITYIATFLSAVSFWSLTFARQPHARMLVPLFVAATTLYAIKKKTILSGILLGLGMYSQASFWAMPLVFWRRYKILLIGLIIIIPLIISFANSGTGFFTNQSYFGEKLAVTDNLPLTQVIQNIVHNISANFFSFFWRGDVTFRLNVPDSPHLDEASALFFFIGFVLLTYQSIKKKQMQYIEFVLLPLLLIQIPSILDIHNPNSQPNIGRMIGIIPFVYMLTAYGLTTVWHFIVSQTIRQPRNKKIVYVLCVSYLLFVIAIANIYKYFVIYPNFLPDQNTPFAKIIAQTMDTYPSSDSFFVIGSAWGQWGQPEQQAIIESLKKPRTINFLQPFTPTNELCNTIQTVRGQMIFITSPTDSNNQTKIVSCGKAITAYIIQKNGYQVARIIEVK